MPSVSDLLRESKLAQVAKPSLRHRLSFTLRGSHFPTHQIIETKPSSLARNDWGLKNSIPTNKYQKQTKYMVVEQLDTLERMTQFEYNGGSQWNRIRFQEMGIIPKFNIGQRNPLFNFKENKLIDESNSDNNINSNNNNSPSINSCDETPRKNTNTYRNRQVIGDSQLRMISQVLNVNNPTSPNNHHNGNHGTMTMKQEKIQLKSKLNLLRQYRKEFKEWLLANYPESLLHKRFNSMELKDKASQFLQEKLYSKSKNNPIGYINDRIVGTGGLTYNLSGRLKVTPHGIRDKVIVPGRILSNTTNRGMRSSTHGGMYNNNNSHSSNKNNVMYSAAIGGFLAKANFNNGAKISYGMGSFLRELVLPFEVENVTMEPNGRIHMTASTITVMKPNEETLSTSNPNNRYGNNNSHNHNNMNMNLNFNKQSFIHNQSMGSRRQNSKKEINDLLYTLENTGKD
ncbi:hypothetical protein RI543_004397 [Arxiozyma heterogenica]|uniref:Uncharacterized protein n=1 Tax=Arxiozyma heterogenica TaxID=278026 RepID=A0AAN8A7Z0_9SACH|nr:hypothetical protein RI543_004397 [Kazachstania heterogenica]